jgi:hypothetical protein
MTVADIQYVDTDLLGTAMVDEDPDASLVGIGLH